MFPERITVPMHTKYNAGLMQDVFSVHVRSTAMSLQTAAGTVLMIDRI